MFNRGKLLEIVRNLYIQIKMVHKVSDNGRKIPICIPILLSVSSLFGDDPKKHC